MSQLMAALQQQYWPLESDGESDGLNSQVEKEEIYMGRGPLYRNAFFTILIVNAVAVLLWISSIVESGKDKPSIAAPNAILESLQHDVTVVFKPDERFQNFSLDHGNEDPWESLLPPGRGFIEIPMYMSSGGDLTEPASNHYAISVFHQLHCLASLQSIFAALTSKSDSLPQSGHDHIHGLDHGPHCFDYLRQAIMCAGDTSLEEALIVPGIGSEGLPTRNVDGWGTAHLCRDWGVIWGFAKSHRYRNSSGIL